MRRFAHFIILASFPALMSCAAILGRQPSFIEPTITAASPGDEGCLVAGEIKDPKARPIAGAMVWIAFREKNEPDRLQYTRIRSDARGQFSSSLPEVQGSVSVSVFAKQHCKTIGNKYTLDKSSQLFLSVVMVPCSCGPGSSCEECTILTSDPRAIIDRRSTSCGATVVIDPKTGEPVSHPF